MADLCIGTSTAFFPYSRNMVELALVVLLQQNN